SSLGLDLNLVNEFRRCSRPGCGRPAVATLTYAYSEQTAVVGPLVEEEDPHSWDLCSHHAEKITAPQGWELVRVDHIELEDDEDLLALAEAVREAGRVTTGLIDDSPLVVGKTRSTIKPTLMVQTRNGLTIRSFAPDGLPTPISDAVRICPSCRMSRVRFNTPGRAMIYATRLPTSGRK